MRLMPDFVSRAFEEYTQLGGQKAWVNCELHGNSTKGHRSCVLLHTVQNTNTPSTATMPFIKKRSIPMSFLSKEKYPAMRVKGPEGSGRGF